MSPSPISPTERETVKLVEAAGRKALAVVCDVSKEESVAAMAKQVQRKFGRVDIVVNCAGIFPQQDFADHDFADWRKVLAINLDGTFLVTSAFVPGMRARQWGRVVSMASSTFGSVTTGFAHYVASKGGIIGFTRGLAGDVAADGITVNAIAPGLTRSPGTLVRKPRPGFATMDEEFIAVASLQAIKRRGSAGRSRRRGVVSHQRRCGVHDRADVECRWWKGEVVRARFVTLGCLPESLT